MPQHVSLWVYLVWTSLHFLDLTDYSLSYVREAFYYSLLNYFLRCFHFVFWELYNLNVGACNVIPEVSEADVNFFFFFKKFCSVAIIFTILCIHHFIQLIHSTSVILLLVSSSIFSISVTVFFITHCCLVSLDYC